MTDQDPFVFSWFLSAALNKGEQGVSRDVLLGRIPPHDALMSLRHSKACVWRLSTIRAWKPAVADRCAALLHPLDSLPAA